MRPCLLFGVQAAMESDRRFFSGRPDRLHRIRPFIRGEARKEEAPFRFTSVAQIKPGVRIRGFHLTFDQAKERIKEIFCQVAKGPNLQP